jgi:large subunit ribosomal protein L17
MRHKQKGRTFGRKRDTRQAFVSSLLEALIKREKILTTEARAIAKKLVEVLGPRYKDRKGGYVRITKIVKRASDGRKSAVIELI